MSFFASEFLIFAQSLGSHPALIHPSLDEGFHSDRYDSLTCVANHAKNAVERLANFPRRNRFCWLRRFQLSQRLVGRS
jgi:hypothetical protein